MNQTSPTSATTSARGLGPATPAGRFGLAASLAAIAYVVLPAHPAAETVPVAVHAAAALAVLAGIAIYGPARASSWRYIAVAIGIHAVAVAVHGLELAGGGPEGRSAAIALLAYPPMFVGVWGVSARRLPLGFGDHRWMMATLTVCALGWLTLVQPTLADGSFSLRMADRAGAHALLDAILLAVVGRRVIAPHRRNRSLWLATAGFVAWGDAHAIVGSQVYGGNFVSTSTAAGSLMIGPVVLAMAALVPDMASTGERGDTTCWYRRSIRELAVTSVILVAVAATMVVALTGAFAVWLAAAILCIAIVAMAGDALERVGSLVDEPIGAADAIDAPAADRATGSPTLAEPATTPSATGAPQTFGPPRPRSVTRSPERSTVTRIRDEQFPRAARLVPPPEELELLYLPYVDLGTGAVVGVEALVRWRHRVRGLLAPADFFGNLGRSEALRRIDDWVVVNAIRSAASWRSPVLIGVNVSPAHLADRHWSDLLVETLESTGVEADRIVVETTERAFLDEESTVFAHARRLRDAGIHVAIDDFGRETGSLRTLVRAPVDVIKLRSGGLGRSGGRIDAAALRASRSAGHRTALLGIDTPELLRQARDLGVELGQGFQLCRPLSSEIVARRLDPGSAATSTSTSMSS